MGDPKKIRKKYETPSHPWIKSRIEEEKRVAKHYGTRNKKEIWKMDTVLKNFKTQAKKLIALHSDQSKIETEHLFRRVRELGLTSQDVTFDVILGLTLDNVMDRRLQTVLYKKGLARSVNQARQFIVHGHVLVEGKKITSPAYLVTIKEEASMSFSVGSPLISEEHPERVDLEALAQAQAKRELLAKQEAEELAKKLEREAREKAEGIEEIPPEEELLPVAEEEKVAPVEEPKGGEQ